MSLAYDHPNDPANEDPLFGMALRVVADGLVAKAESLPRKSDAARLLRDAATSLLDADTALERETDQ